MAVSSDYLAFLADQMRGFGPYQVRRMFSGAGLFRDGLMFALASGDALFFKIDAATLPAFQAKGSKPFAYSRAGVHRAIPSWYEAPADVLDDADALVAWARNAVGAAIRAAKAKSRPKGGGKPAKKSARSARARSRRR